MAVRARPDRPVAARSRPVAFAAALVQARDAKRLSVRQVARAIGKTPGFYSALEHTTGEPSVAPATLRALARVLALDPDMLFLLAGRVPPDLLPRTKAELVALRAFRLLSPADRARQLRQAQRAVYHAERARGRTDARARLAADIAPEAPAPPRGRRTPADRPSGRRTAASSASTDAAARRPRR